MSLPSRRTRLDGVARSVKRYRLIVPTPFGGGTDLVVVKLGADGSHLWSKSFGDEEDQRSTFGGLAVDANDNVLVSVELRGSMTVGDTMLTSAGLEDVAFMKLSPAGEPRFAVSAGDEQFQWLAGIGVDDGYLLVTGSFQGVMDLGPGPLSGPLFGGKMFVAKLAP
jgi:hypothetical protein